MPIYAYRDALLSFRTAVLDYGQTIGDFRTKRKYTVQKNKVPESAFRKYPQLIEFNEDDYSFRLTEGFKTAIAEAETKAEAHRAATTNPH